MTSSSTHERRPGLHPALSSRQGAALIEEAGSVQNLMRDSVDAIRSLRFVSRHGDAVFTLGSIGVEKTMKVMLGCHEVEKTGMWPSQTKLQRWGHGVAKLDTRLRRAVDKNLPNATHVGYAKTLAANINASEILPLLFATFDRYGKSGRFHHLDILATDEPGTDDPPSAYWEQVELRVRTTDSGFQDVPYGDNRALEEYETRLRNRIADELETWWYCIHLLGLQGCFGDLGRKIGSTIWEVGRPGPDLAPG